MRSAVIAAEGMAIAVVLIILISNLIIRKGKQNNIERDFSILTGICLLIEACDMFSYILNNSAPYSLPLYILNSIACVSGLLATCCFNEYIYVKLSERVSISPHLRTAARIMGAAGLVTELVLIATNNLFRIENGTFISLPLYPLVFLIAMLLGIFPFIYGYIARKKIPCSEVCTIYIYMLIPVIIAVIELFIADRMYGATFVYASFALSLLIINTTMHQRYVIELQEHEQLLAELSATDALTSLPNRRAATVRVNAAMNDESPVGIIYCDMNKLKYVNDTEGHAAGDAMIIRFSELLCSLFSAQDVFRISGDEFIIIADGISETSFGNITEKLRQLLLDADEIACMGTAWGTGKVVRPLIHQAEEMMYEYKREFHERWDRIHPR